MTAFFLTVVLFASWWTLGYALLWRLHCRANLLQSALLSPAVGAAAIAIAVTTLNTAGLPLRYGGPAASVALTGLCLYLWRRDRPTIPARRLAPFVAILLVAAIATGYPMFHFGFNWISYANDDMTTYSFGAKLFLNHGIFTVPTEAAIVSGRDASPLYWCFYAVDAMRRGADEMLAWVLSMTGLSAHQAFMPTILAFHLVLIAAVGGLVLRGKRFRRAALLACFAMAFSALATLGATYQLLGQVTGLGALTAACAVLLRPLSSRWGAAAVAGIPIAGTALYYPEVLPFLGISFVAYHALAIARKQATLRDVGRWLWPTSVLTALFLNVCVLTAGITLIDQSKTLTSPPGSGDTLFPFLTPSGLACLWGFHAMSQPPFGCLLDIGVIAGGVLLLVAMALSARQAWRGYPAAIVMLTMAAVCIQLVRVRSDFGLYKIAMYVQPFLLSVCAVAWVDFRRKVSRSVPGRWLSLGLLAAVLGWGASSQLAYTQGSMGEGWGGLVEVPYASSEGLVGRLASLPNTPRAYLSDTSNLVLAKLESWYLPVYFTAKDFVGEIRTPVSLSWNPLNSIYRSGVRDLARERARHFESALFDMHGALPSTNRFQFRRESLDGDLPLLETGYRHNVLNRRNKADCTRVVRQSERPNHLLFVESQFGNSYYRSGSDRCNGRVSMYQVESDLFFHDASMVSLGRVSLYRVLNATRPLRMVVEYTASLNGDHANRIPPASAIGSERQAFLVEGSGSARLFSPPLEPQPVAGGDYVALDMGTWGQTFPDRRSKILSLWGSDVLSDSRKVVGFARDISLISSAEYQSLNPPSALRKFPDDLGNKNLEYCGIYEDGWVAESSFAILTEPQGSQDLAVSLMVPALNGRVAANWAAVLLDGKELARRATPGGLVSFRIPVRTPGKHRFELRFDRSVGLPDPDNRPVSALVKYIGFEPSSTAMGSTTH